jgi:lysophospholipase L1-like esterase
MLAISRTALLGILAALAVGCQGAAVTPLPSGAGSADSGASPPTSTTPPGTPAPTGGTPTPPAPTPPAPTPPAPTPPAPTPPAITRFVRPHQRAIWIGDSLAAGGFALGGTSASSNGSFVVSGGPESPVASITTTSQHGLIAGNYVQIYDVGDVTYTAALNGAVVPVLTVPGPTQLTVAATVGDATMANGDYTAGYSDSPWEIRAMNEILDTSWLSWLNVYQKGYFTVVANYAQGGTSSSVGVTLIPKIQAGPSADYAFIQYCTNDLNSPAPDVAGCLKNINTIVAAVLALGMVPIVCTPLPIGDVNVSPDPASIVKTTALRSVRSALLALAASNPKVLVLDSYSAGVDPQDPLGRFVPNYAPIDGVHPSSFGGASIAESIATYLTQFLPPIDNLPTSVDDDQTVNPGADNIVQNGLMTGSGGNVGNDAYDRVTGTPPTGWEISGSGGSAAQPLVLAVSGNNSYANFAGYTFDVVVQSAYASQLFQTGTNGSGGSSFGGRMQPNQWYRCGFQAFSQGALNGLNLSGQVFLNFGGGNAPSIYFMSGQGNERQNGIPMAAGQVLTFESQPFFVPAAPTAGAWLFINGLFTSQVTNQRVSIGRAFCHIVPSPYQ